MLPEIFDDFFFLCILKLIDNTSLITKFKYVEFKLLSIISVQLLVFHCNILRVRKKLVSELIVDLSQSSSANVFNINCFCHVPCPIKCGNVRSYETLSVFMGESTSIAVAPRRCLLYGCYIVGNKTVTSKIL